MMSLPAVLPGAAPTADADVAGASAGDSADSLGAFLDRFTDKPLPPALRGELLAGLKAGKPLSDVLADLADLVDELPDVNLMPAMLPVLQTLAPRVRLANADVPGNLAAPGNKAPVAGARDEVLSEASEKALAGVDGGQEEGLLARHKVAVGARLTSVEGLPGNTAMTGLLHQQPLLRGLEVPGAMAGLPAAAADGPDGLLIPQRVGDAQWGQALAQRVVWMVGQDRQVAELKLNPAHLGPLEVKLTLHHDQASVALLASTGAVRDALEQALPRLRDLLGQQDIQLAQVDIGQRQSGAQAEQGGQAFAGGESHGQRTGHAGVDVDDAAMDAPTAGSPAITGIGLLDTYA